VSCRREKKSEIVSLAAKAKTITSEWQSRKKEIANRLK